MADETSIPSPLKSTKTPRSPEKPPNTVTNASSALPGTSQATRRSTQEVAVRTPSQIQSLLKDITRLQTYYTKDKVSCTICKIIDDRTKAICIQCKTIIHSRCVQNIDVDQFRAGKWRCDACVNEIVHIDEQNRQLNRIGKETEHAQLGLSQLLGLIGGNSTQNIETATSRGQGENQSSKAKSVASRASSSASKTYILQERMKLLDEEREIKQRRINRLKEEQLEHRKRWEEEYAARLERIRLEDEADKAHLDAKKALLDTAAEGDDAISVVSSEIRNDNVSNWLQKLTQNRSVRFDKAPSAPIQRNLPNPRSSGDHSKNTSLPWLDHSSAHFFDTSKSRDTSIPNELNLSRSQIQARHVISKELPVFSGDPKHWPFFITAYVDTSEQCGFTDRENMARLSKCLKGNALEAVRSDLLLPSSLPTALNTLRMLYGRPELIFSAVVEQVRQTAVVKLEHLETLITFAMRIKSLVDTINAAGMPHYLQNPTLLMEMVRKLPAVLRLEWSRYQEQEERKDPIITIGTFNQWLRTIVETASRVSDEPAGSIVTNSTGTRRRGQRGDQKEAFHAVHKAETQATPPSKGGPFCHSCRAKGHEIGKCRHFQKLANVRRWNFVKRRNLCISCLGKHWLRDCTERKICGINNCDQPHNPLLHTFRDKPTGSEDCSNSRQQSAPSSDPVASTSAASQELVNLHRNEECAYHQMVPVKLYGNNGCTIDTHAFLDTGSTITLMEEDVAVELGLEGLPAHLRLKWTNDVVREEPSSRKVTLQMSGYDGKKYLLKDVRTTSKLNLPVQSLDVESVLKLRHIRDLPLETYKKVQPRLLIGLDQHQLMTPQETAEGEWNDPVAIRTRLGWTLLGGNEKAQSWSATVNSHQLDDDNLHDLVNDFFTLESLGVTAPKNPVESLEDTRAKTILRNTVKRLDDGHFESGLLWRSDYTKLPDSRQMALSRLRCFEKKLQKNPILAARVKTQFEEYIAKGYLQKLSAEEARISSSRTWVLPIFAVTNPNKPNKTRLVWDAAAAVDGKSLNSELLTGPDYLANLVGILFTFRELRYAISGDIKEMFHQVKIRPEDQDSQRCLWRSDVTKAPDTYRMTVMTFGASCSPATSQFVKNLNAESYKEMYPRAVQAIKERHYVDDFIDSFDSVAECIEVTQQVIKIHKSGGFELRNFIANAPEVLNTLAHDPEVTEKSLADTSDGSKVLGMLWSISDDMLRFKINKERLGLDLLRDNKTPTKRGALRILMSIYDPIGLLSFFIVQGKLIVKEVWRSKVEWDGEIKPDESRKWSAWIRAMAVIEKVRVPRSYFHSRCQDATYELHVFVDASKDATAAVAYLVQAHVDGRREVAFVSSKTKGTPSKITPIPRLELQAAVIGARLSNTIKSKHTIKIDHSVFWTDSRNVLCWIRWPKTFAPFVAFRIGEIRETTKSEEWRWVPTNLNIADAATKWKLTRNKCIPSRWYDGPEFLSLQQNEWPGEQRFEPLPTDDELEVRCLVTTALVQKHNLTPDITRFSSLERLTRVQAYVLRVFYHTKEKTLILTATELEDAMIYLTRSVQQNAFGKEFADLKSHGKIAKDSVLREYSPFIDAQSILRMRSRLQEAEYLTYDQRFPIILPRKCAFTDLLTLHYHHKYYHMNDGTVLNELSQKYAIPRLRSQLKSVRSRCPKCRIRDSRPEVPEMATLPYSRLAARMKPFTFTGVDYFGPMMVKHGRRYEKRWGALFTCLTTRAVHIELASALTSDAFIMVLRNFIGRRGQPCELFSDNGTNFRGAENELRKIVQEMADGSVRDKFSQIKWTFLPPAAPHMGGAWERLVRSVKVGLKYALPERTPSEDLLRCCLIEIEAMINSRPLTYVELDGTTLEALTPNHFLLGSSSGIKPICNLTDDVHVLRTDWKKQQRITQVFWTRWVQEYLPTISKRTRWYDAVKPLQIGDVVAIVITETPYSWQLGRVIAVTPSKDGCIRQADVKTANGVIRRPAAKLAVLFRNEEELEETHSLPIAGEC